MPTSRTKYSDLAALQMLLLLGGLILAFWAVSLRAETHPSQQSSPWPMVGSDLPADPAYKFGRLANGMRYIIRSNATVPGTGMVQFWIGDGSLAEGEGERGFAHFVEHMSFNGSSRVPEGEMVRLLEREGLAFGPDNNATTSFDTTIYKLNLPRNDGPLLDTALMLMREVASELSFDAGSVEREKGVILSERRARDTPELRNNIDRLNFVYIGSRYAQRSPIGTAESIQNATAEGLRSFYRRVYRPDNAALIVIGDFDAAHVEQGIRKHFGDWLPGTPLAVSAAGPIDFNRASETDIFVDPSLVERITVSRSGPWRMESDTTATRQQKIRRQIAYGIINRRLQRLGRGDSPPFRRATFATVNVFQVARATQLIVETGDGLWPRGLAAAHEELRRALRFGFTAGEVAEQVAILRANHEIRAASAETRANSTLVAEVLDLLEDGFIPTSPSSALQRFEAHAPAITPENVLAALQEELVPLTNPLIRFEGRRAPRGATQALRDVWDQSSETLLEPINAYSAPEWAYGQLGPAGTVVSDEVEPLLGVRQLVYSNGLKVSLKRTELQRDRILLELNIDGGQLLNTKEAPLTTDMGSVLAIGGLAQHSADDLQSIFAGRRVGYQFAVAPETFVLNGTTTSRDLELQLQLFAAVVTEPGFRKQGEWEYRRRVRNRFAHLSATPADALSNAIGGIVSDRDPRFTIASIEDYLNLTFADHTQAIRERLRHGAMELSIVGDFDEAAVADMIGRTLGTLPKREPDFLAYAHNRQRSFTADRRSRVLYHDGPSDQALVRLSWPIGDDSDFTKELTLELLERLVRLRLTDSLRERLGQTYSPSVTSAASDVWPGYGTFTVSASVDPVHTRVVRKAIVESIQAIMSSRPSEDDLLRARGPLLELYRNALKTNSGWMNLVSRAQRKPSRISRFSKAGEILRNLTPADVQTAATLYLQPDQVLEITVLPRPSEPRRQRPEGGA